MRKTAIAAIASMSVICVILLVTPILIPTGVVKAKIAALIKQKTGRDLRIAGALHLSLFPQLGFELTDVTLPSPNDDFSSDLLQAKSVRALFGFLPLLRGRIQIDRLELLRPALHLEIDKQGHRNWVFRAPEQPQQAITSQSNNARFAAVVTDLTVVRGTADYLDQRNGERRVVTNLDLNFSMPEQSLPAKAKGEAIWNGKTVTIYATATSPEKLWRGGVSPFTFHLFSAPIEADFAGNAEGGPHPQMIGAIHLDAPSMRAFVEWVGLRFPMHGEGFEHFTLRGKIEAARSRLNLTDTAIALDSSSARGALSLERRDPRPILSGHLDIATLDLDPYFEHQPAETSPLPDAPPTRTISAAGAGEATPQPERPREAHPPHWSTIPFDSKLLQLADTDLKLNANAIHFRGVELGNSALTLHLEHGRLTLDLTAMSLYRGAGSGKIIADGAGTALAVAANVELHGIEAGPLLAAVAGFDQLAGSGDVSLALSGNGDNEKEIVSSLSGTCRISLTNGKFSGPGLLTLTKTISGPFAYSLPKTIIFQSLSGSGTITEGILHNGDLKIVSPKMLVLGSGTIDLRAHSLDYLWLQQLPKLGSARIMITGPWSAPIYTVKSVSINGGVLAPLVK